MATTGGQSFWLNDRRVIVRTGTKSQTVNVCTRQNAPGEYEAVYRLPLLSAIAAADVPAMADLHAFGTWLVETRNALLEGPSGQPVIPAAVGIRRDTQPSRTRNEAIISAPSQAGSA